MRSRKPRAKAAGKKKIHSGGNLPGYAAVVLFCVIWASFRGGPLPYLCLFSALLYLPVSALFAAYASYSLSLHQELPSLRVEKLVSHPYRLVLENGGFLRINGLRLIMEKERSATEGIPEEEEIRLLPGEKMELAGSTVCRYAGTYETGLTEMTISDAFGVLRIPLKMPTPLRVTVMPRVTGIADEVLDFENLRSSDALRSRRRKEPLPGNEVRDYQPGDPLRHIHWKNAARTGQLTVRVPDDLMTRQILLVMEAEQTPPASRDLGFIMRRDRFLEFAVSAAWHFADRGEPLTVLAPRGNIRTFYIESHESFLQFYEEISKGPYYDSAGTAEQLAAMAETAAEDEADRVVITLRENEIHTEHFFTVRG